MENWKRFQNGFSEEIFHFPVEIRGSGYDFHDAGSQLIKKQN